MQKYMDLPMHIFSYDINCQFQARWDQRQEQMRKLQHILPSIKNLNFPPIVPVIGTFHNAAHKEECQSLFSSQFVPGCARNEGEASERIWAILNMLALRTQEMTPGHRHDVINHFLGDMNMRNMNQMGMFYLL